MSHTKFSPWGALEVGWSRFTINYLNYFIVLVMLYGTQIALNALGALLVLMLLATTGNLQTDNISLEVSIAIQAIDSFVSLLSFILSIVAALGFVLYGLCAARSIAKPPRIFPNPTAVLKFIASWLIIAIPSVMLMTALLVPAAIYVLQYVGSEDIGWKALASLWYIIPAYGMALIILALIAIRLQFFPFLIIDKQVGPIAALTQSFRMTSGSWLRLIALSIIGFLITLAVFVIPMAVWLVLAWNMLGFITAAFENSQIPWQEVPIGALIAACMTSILAFLVEIFIVTPWLTTTQAYVYDQLSLESGETMSTHISLPESPLNHPQVIT